MEAPMILLARVARAGTNPYRMRPDQLEEHLFVRYPTLVDYEAEYVDEDIEDIVALLQFFNWLGSPTAPACLDLLKDNPASRVMAAATAHDAAVRRGHIPEESWIRGWKQRLRSDQV
jgi:hypothetical protein